MGLLYKIALDQRKEIHKKEKEWAKIMKENATPDGKMNLAGKLAEMQLMRSLESNGLFDRAVKSSSLLSAIPDKTTAKNYAMSNAKTSAKMRFFLKEAKESTAIAVDSSHYHHW